MKILESVSLYYSDVNLIAQPNFLIKSRSEITRNPSKIFVSPMPSVVGEKFILAGLKYGINIGVHRFCTVEKQLEMLRCAISFYGERVCANSLWFAIGLNDIERLKNLYANGARGFIIDVANGYLNSVVSFAETVALLFPCARFMVGNVHSATGFNLYKDIQNLSIRVGIASGSGCSTSGATGINRGQITEISECARFKNNKSHYIVADGGIKDAGCAVKALAAGADMLMLGGFFSFAEEAENVVTGRYKFWGCASSYNQEMYGGLRSHSEGKVFDINKNDIVPLETLINNLFGGISSGVSYAGFNSWDGLIGNGVFEIKK